MNGAQQNKIMVHELNSSYPITLELVDESTQGSPRSSDRLITLSVVNKSEFDLRIASISTLIPRGVKLISQGKSTYVRREELYKILCKEIRILVQDEFFFSSQEVQNIRRKQIINWINSAILSSQSSSFLQKVVKILQILLSPLTQILVHKRWNERFNASQVLIDNYDDAKKVWDYVSALPCPNGDSGLRLRSLIELKLSQLKMMEEGQNPSSQKTENWVLAKNQAYTEQFILECQENSLSTRRLPVGVEIVLELIPSTKILTMRAATSFQIPPNETVLAIVAALSAPFGVIIKTIVRDQNVDLLNLLSRINSSQFFLSMILGAALYLLYDMIKWGKTAQLVPNWRTSIFLGLGAGLGAESLLVAIRAFFGITA